jgi:hypothetical protein
MWKLLLVREFLVSSVPDELSYTPVFSNLGNFTLVKVRYNFGEKVASIEILRTYHNLFEYVICVLKICPILK